MEDDDRRDLEAFLDEFRAMIDIAFEQNREWFPEQLIDQLEEAWRDLEPRFKEIKDGIESGEFDEILDAEDLSGPQLRVKRAVWVAVLKELDRERQARPRGGFFPRLLGWGGGVLRLFKTGLGLANDILESIGKAIPPAGAVKEFKGILEGAISLKEHAGGRIGGVLRRLF
jgi:hypothetical protein